MGNDFVSPDVILSDTHPPAQVEPGTPFASLYRPGVAPLPDEDTAADMLRLASTLLTASGYEHYEISNFARPGHRSRHNATYWAGDAYYGFGMGATSYLQVSDIF